MEDGSTQADDGFNRRRGDSDPWYSDKRIPLGLIFAFLLQGGSVIWFQAGQSAKVEEHERRLVIQESTLTGTNGVAERLIPS